MRDSCFNIKNNKTQDCLYDTLIYIHRLFSNSVIQPASSVPLGSQTRVNALQALTETTGNRIQRCTLVYWWRTEAHQYYLLPVSVCVCVCV